MHAFFTKLIKDESGVTAIEYGLIAALIAVAAVTVHDNGRHQPERHFSKSQPACNGPADCQAGGRGSRSSVGRLLFPLSPSLSPSKQPKRGRFMPASGSLSTAFPGGWLTRQRVSLYCAILLAVEIAVFLFMAAGTHGLIVPLAETHEHRFCQLLRKLEAWPTPGPATRLRQSRALRRRRARHGRGINYNFFYYPPPFLLLCSILAHLPIYAAFLIFEAASLFSYLFVACRILGHCDRASLVCLLAFPSVLWTLGWAERVAHRGTVWRRPTLFLDRRPHWRVSSLGHSVISRIFAS